MEKVVYPGSARDAMLVSVIDMLVMETFRRVYKLT